MSKNSKYVPVKQSNTTTYVLAGVVVVLIAAIVFGGIWYANKNEGSTTEAARTAAAAETTKGQSFVVGAATAPTIDIFEDFLCPYCAEFEKASGDAIVKAVEAGTLRVRYHVLDFLNEGSASKDYSSRAAGAVLSIANSSLTDEQKTKAWLAFHTALFADQPAESGATDHSNAQLAEIAQKAATGVGVTLPAEVVTAITSGANTQRASTLASEGSDLLNEWGGSGTPAVFHQGAQVDTSSAEWLSSIVGGSGS